MKISGFSFVKNGEKLYFPIREVIESALPLVDEFVVAVGDCDPDDSSRAEIEAINSPKIKIIDTVWDLEAYPRGMENAHQTDIAKSHCSGDWLLYLQGDELIHEKDHAVIRKRCEELLDDQEIEGLLFKYNHFWGDYDHVHRSHGWYRKEIRIVRNDPEIHSWESAQSFRRIPNFDGKNYRQQEGTYKLRVAEVDAYIYHYGWVRPPSVMLNKKKALDTIHKGSKRVGEIYKDSPAQFDYGNMSRIPIFTESHPAVMETFIKKFNWADQLRYDNEEPDRPLFKHEKLKYRILSWIENNIMGGRGIFGFRNYLLINR
ncbi:MAG: hypothetical protein AAFR87_15730 [Bacteroidota bacterium]